MVCATSPISLDLHKKWELGFTALTFNPSQGMQSLLNIKPPPICALTLHQHLQAILARWESTPLTLDLPFLTLPLLPPLLVPSPTPPPLLLPPLDSIFSAATQKATKVTFRTSTKPT